MSKFIKVFFSILCFTLLQSCPSDDDGSMQDQEDLQDVVAELIFFNYTPQDGNTPDRLQYEIVYTNPNNVSITGFYRVTTLATFGTETIEASSLSTDSSVCYVIEANSNCTFSFDESGDINIGSADSIEFVSTQYVIDSSN